MPDSTLKVSVQTDDRVRLLCNLCGTDTNHDVLAMVEQVKHDPILSTSIAHRVLQCRGCETLTSQTMASDEMSFAENPDTGERDQLYDVAYLPPRQAGRKSLKHSYDLPPVVGAVYKEVLSAMFGNMRMLAAMGLRTLVEAICNDQEAAGKTLVEKINSLRDSKILTPAGADILHRVRALGNAAAHEAGPQRLSDLWNAVDVVEHTLAAVYILPARAAKKGGKIQPPGDIPF